MMDFINQYLPQIATVSAVLVPMVPLALKRTISDKNLLGKVDQVKAVAEKLSAKEISLTKDVSMLANATQNMKVEIDHIGTGVKDEMAKVSEQLLGFQQGDMYQKMLNGLGTLEKMEAIIKSNEALIQQQAATIKEIKKKLG